MRKAIVALVALILALVAFPAFGDLPPPDGVLGTPTWECAQLTDTQFKAKTSVEPVLARLNEDSTQSLDGGVYGARLLTHKGTITGLTTFAAHLNLGGGQDPDSCPAGGARGSAQ